MKQNEFQYDISNEDEITKHILYANATFDLNEVFSNDANVLWLSVTIITPSQKLSVMFHDFQVTGGHARITDIMLKRIYPDYIPASFSGDQKIYSKNKEHNIFILTGIASVVVFLPSGNRINQMQYESLNQYMSALKETKYMKSGGILGFEFGDGLFLIDQLDNKMEELKHCIDQVEIPKQYSIGQVDFKNCTNENEISLRIEEYLDRLTKKEQKL